MIVLDARERDLATHLDEGTFRLETLTVADVLVLDADGAVAVAIERKTSADLRASLRDGRYAEQRARMLEAYGANAAYVIDGSDGFGTDLAGPLCGLMFRHRITTVRTSDLRETAAFVNHLHKCALEGRLAAGVSRTSVTKRRAETVQDIGVSMLAAIPGVSTRVARELLELHGSLAGLVRFCSSDSSLADVKIGGRRLGKVGDKLTSILKPI